MLCCIHIDTGLEQIEAISEFPDIPAAKHDAIEKARDYLSRQLSQSRFVLPEFFVWISSVSGELLAVLTLRTIIFGEASRMAAAATYMPP